MSAAGPGAERSGKDRWRAYRLRWGRVLVSGLSLAAGAVLGLSLPAGGSPGSEVMVKDIRLPDPIEALKQAEAATPYPVRLPRTLPPDAELALVVWDTPETLEEPGRWDVAAWYWLAPGGILRGKLHIWQTNAPEASTWIEEYEPITIDGAGWKLTRSQLGVFELATTLPDGVTLGISAPPELVPLEVLEETAASIAPTEPQASA